MYFGTEASFEGARSIELERYMSAKLESLRRTIEGKRAGELNAEKEMSLLSALTQRMNKINLRGN